MFTGIVQGLCPVTRIQDLANLRQIQVDLGELGDNLALGASVAINGVCLTVTDRLDGLTSFDVIAETLHLTNLADLVPGAKVNVERSLRFGDEIGGHLVSGHVFATATLARAEVQENLRVLWFHAEAAVLARLFYKGFVAVDGASLTISALDRGAGLFAVSLIPETIQRTTLGQLLSGGRVNIEIDSQAQAVAETLELMLGDEGWLQRLRSLLGPGA